MTTRDPIGSKRNKAFAKLLKLKSAKQLTATVTYFAKLTPSQRNSLKAENDFTRISPTNRYEFKAYADITGNPGDVGFCIIDNSKRDKFIPLDTPTHTCDMLTGPCSCGAWH